MTIGVGSVIFGITVTLLASVLRTERTARQHLTETQTIGRLALQFRQDAHAATNAELTPPANTASPALHLTSHDGSHLEYQWTEGGLRRTQSHAGQAASREVFLLPSVAAATFDVQPAGSAEMAILHLESRPSDSHGRAGRNLRIETQIGSTNQSRSPSSP